MTRTAWPPPAATPVNDRIRWMGQYHTRFTDLPASLCEELIEQAASLDPQTEPAADRYADCSFDPRGGARPGRRI